MSGTPCWEHMHCPVKTDCPAYPNEGYACWSVEGTLCRGEKQPDYSRKVGACRNAVSLLQRSDERSHQSYLRLS